jgi:hypothetical protein
VFVVLDAEQADRQLRAGRLACPVCGQRLRPWAWARPRPVRLREGGVVWLRPRRARCHGCTGTHVLLPAAALPRCGDAAEVVGAALTAAAAGHGHRRIAADLHRPASTIRRWLRRARRRAEWLRGRGVDHAAALDPDLLAKLHPRATALGDALAALAAAVHAVRRRLGSAVPAWPLIVVLTGGRLLTPLRGS